MSDEHIKLERDLENIFSSNDPILETLFSCATLHYSNLRGDRGRWESVPKSLRLLLEDVNEYITVDRPDQLNEIIESEIGVLNEAHGPEGMDSMVRSIISQDNDALRKIVSLPFRLSLASTFSQKK